MRHKEIGKIKGVKNKNKMDTFELVHWIQALIEHKNIKAFYNSAIWHHVRDEALERDHYECQKCKSRGKYSKADCVHHKKHIKQYPELALTLDNTVSLCDSCHDEEHPEKLHHKTKIKWDDERW